jgi:hypothetical protein
MVSAELEPVTRTFGTTVVKDDALAAYATHVHIAVVQLEYLLTWYLIHIYTS